MSNYTKTVNFATKDNLSPGNPLKIVKGTEIDTEYNNIATAIATKTDNSAAAITGGAIDGATVGSTTPAAGAFTTLAASSTTTLAGALVGAVTQAAFNTVSTTLNLGGAATAVNIGAATGTATVANTTLAAKAITASTTLNVTGASTLTGAVTATAGVTGPITSSSVSITGGSITGITDLAVADGGTGSSTAAGALNNLLPSQTSAANKYLQSDGTNASWDAVSLSTADITGTLGVANGGTGVTTSTGTTNVVLSNSPTLVTPALGTPSAAVLTNATGLPISTGVSGLGTGVATLLATPSSANLASAITDETGSGSLVFATSPTLVTPILGTPTSATLTNATGLPISTGVSGLGTGVATFLATPSSANLAAALTDETGSGANVFATSPTLVTPILGTPTSVTLTNATGLPLTTGVTGTLPVLNGGTGVTTSTGSGNNVLSTSPTLVTPVLGTPTSATLTNATGLPISTGVSGLGTGIATALAVNTGSAGAPVLFNGALGTPSSGTVTNLTGTASININGTVGATTATTGAFTTVTASTAIGTASGGTGLGGATPFTSGGVVYASSSSVLATGANLTFNGNTLTSSNATGANVIFNSTANAPYVSFAESGASKFLLGASAVVAGGAGYDFYGVAGIGLTFFTNAARVLDITSAGNVGIGTSSPSAKLDVGATSDVGFALSNSSSVTSGNRGNIYMLNSSLATVGLIRFGAVTDNVGTEIQFHTRPAAGSLTEFLRIASTGAFGLSGANYGTSGQVLTSGGSAAAPTWANAGKVLQVVQGTTTTQATTTSGNWDSTGLTASITPTSSSSKVLVLVSGGMEGGAGGTGDQRIGFKVYRGASSIEASSGGKVIYALPNIYVPINFIALDSPATTSSTAYTLYFKRISGDTTASFCRDSAETANIVLMEIAA